MIEVENDGTLCVLTINRPDKANSLTADMLEALCVGVEEARGARAIILTGQGKVFSAGADLEAAKAGLALSPLWERLSGAIVRHSGLTITALNGTAAGGALGMVLACDLRIAVPGTKVFYPVMKLGFLPQPSDPARLSALVGPSRAKMILMAGQKIPTDDALTWGLIDEIADPDHLMDRARELTHDVCGATPEHARAIKGLIAQSLP
ncbi:enoyl-CoA hydratase/isomerase family protein [uncultured Marivita sp.]|uniref:enoyl-CoA hydratase/isomerase family protein n=1 Tax=uncultured Marivita sp. TaxID=888080 RepID=UPI002625191C|nr:enoyl-CoA hydratase/isomerase family protein [uncultured Marivita sp.]